MNDPNVGIFTEVWKPVHIECFREYYSVSSHGRVRRDKAGRGTCVGKIRKNKIDPDGYCTVDLWATPNKRCLRVHVLVAWVFLGPPPGPTGARRGEYQVNHKDTVKTNNYANNLEWLTVEEHIAHSTINGLRTRKLTKADVLAIRERHKGGDVSGRALGREYGVSERTIFRVLNRVIWTWI